MLETSNLLQTSVSRYIVFRFVKIESTSENTQEFSWLSFKEASSYIIELSNSQGIVFREKVAATNDIRETYSYEKAILKPGDDYLFTVEIDPQISFVDSCNVNNEEIIAESVAQGINQIKQLGIFNQTKVTLLAQLDSLLIARNELLNIIWSIVRQGSNSEIICFLNSFLAQNSAFTLLKKSYSADDVLDAISEIANQLATANITLSEYLSLSGVQTSLVESLGEKGIELAYFGQNLQNNFKLKSIFNVSMSGQCKPWCSSLPRWIRCSIGYSPYCGGCESCRESNT